MEAEATMPEPDQTTTPTGDATGGALASQEDNGLCLGGQWGESGTLQIPQFSLVQPSMEELIEIAAPGSFVYDKSIVLREGVGKEPLPFTLLRADQYWREKLSEEDYAANKQPRNFNSVEEALAAGLRKAGGKDWGAGTVASASRSLVLVEVPEDFGTLQYKDQHFVKAMWFAHGVCFSPTSNIVTTVMQDKGAGGRTYVYNVALTSEKGKRPTYVTPKLHKRGKHDAEFIDWIEKEVL